MAAIGCSVAWGVIDATLYVFGSLFYRSQRAHFFRTLKRAHSETEALATVQEEFGLEDEPLAIHPEDRARLYQAILALKHPRDARPCAPTAAGFRICSRRLCPGIDHSPARRDPVSGAGGFLSGTSVVEFGAYLAALSRRILVGALH
jgi:hypothetical protein